MKQMPIFRSVEIDPTIIFPDAFNDLINVTSFISDIFPKREVLIMIFIPFHSGEEAHSANVKLYITWSTKSCTKEIFINCFKKVFR